MDIMINKKGQALVEYVLIIAVISVIVISVVNIFGGYLKDSITKTSCSLVGKEYKEGGARWFEGAGDKPYFRVKITY